MVEKHKEELAILEALDNGKPKSHFELIDLPLSVDVLRYYAAWPDKIHGKTLPLDGPYEGFTRREPAGVAALLTPWDLPFLTAVMKLAPALASGCTVVIKPSKSAPLSVLHLGQMVVEAGFPDGVLNIVPGPGPETGDALVKHPMVDTVAFSGSRKVGKHIRALCGERNLKRVALEMGGKCPLIIMKDTDIKEAI